MRPKVLRYKLKGRRSVYHQNGYGGRRRHNQKGGSLIGAVSGIIRGVAGPLLSTLGLGGGGGGGGNNTAMIQQMMRQNQQNNRQMMMQMMQMISMMNKNRR